MGWEGGRSEEAWMARAWLRSRAGHVLHIVSTLSSRMDFKCFFSDSQFLDGLRGPSSKMEGREPGSDNSSAQTLCPLCGALPGAGAVLELSPAGPALQQSPGLRAWLLLTHCVCHRRCVPRAPAGWDEGNQKPSRMLIRDPGSC